MEFPYPASTRNEATRAKRIELSGNKQMGIEAAVARKIKFLYVC
jgi:hypothetical protein